MARGKKTDTNRITAIIRRDKAFNLRLEGQSYREIAQELGMSVGQAWADVNNALEETAALDQDKVKTLREMELARLDALHAGYWTKAKNGDALAASIILKVADRRARLLGLDKPAELNISQVVTTGPNWNAQQLAILEALREYPEARAAVGKRLADLNVIEGELVHGGE